MNEQHNSPSGETTNPQNSSVGGATTTFPVLEGMSGVDIEALCFLVLWEASKSAQEDLASIMAGINAINAEKNQARKLAEWERRQLAAVAASVIASNLRPAAILSAPDYSLDAARQLCRWIEFVAKGDGNNHPKG